jgi:hypothetical protein
MTGCNAGNLCIMVWSAHSHMPSYIGGKTATMHACQHTPHEAVQECYLQEYELHTT